jgi:hypothetical protein
VPGDGAFKDHGKRARLCPVHHRRCPGTRRD